uniref:Uncharacterized protein n=1 Tax=Oryza punctata TaxID=4537 RepID=A0A0E0MM91_ORYPU
MDCTAVREPEPVRLRRSTKAATKLRASSLDVRQHLWQQGGGVFTWVKSNNQWLLQVIYHIGDKNKQVLHLHIVLHVAGRRG